MSKSRIRFRDAYNYWMVETKSRQWIGSIVWQKDWKKWAFEPWEYGDGIRPPGQSSTRHTADCLIEVAEFMKKLRPPTEEVLNGLMPPENGQTAKNQVIPIKKEG